MRFERRAWQLTVVALHAEASCVFDDPIAKELNVTGVPTPFHRTYVVHAPVKVYSRARSGDARTDWGGAPEKALLSIDVNQ